VTLGVEEGIKISVKQLFNSFWQRKLQQF